MEFAYVRVSTAGQSTDSQVADITAQYPDADIHTDHGISGTVPALERPELSRLLDKLRKGDVLVVWWVDRLGRDYYDVTNTLRELVQCGVTIKTINGNRTFANSKEHRAMTDIMITLYADQAENERTNRLASAEAGRQALRKTPELWKEKFQGRKANQELHEKIAAQLELGTSIRKTAELLGCGISTVQRVKRNLS